VNKTRVLIIDDQLIARSYFEMRIQASPKYEVVCSLNSAEDAPEYCRSHPVDLVIMDVVMQRGMTGLDAAEVIKAEHPKVRVIIVTSIPEVSYMRRARQIRVDSFWYKEYEEAPLLEVMDRTMAGESVYPTDAPVVYLGEARSTELTEQELAVLREITSGLSNEEIARKLFISVNTVRWHVKNLLSKTGFNSRIKLAIYARASGLVLGDVDENMRMN